MRLRKAVKLRKEAIAFFKEHQGDQDVVSGETSQRDKETPDAPQASSSESITNKFRKMRSDLSMSLRQIDEINESESASSES